MAVIQYKCDTCKRIIELPQNKHGLEVIQKCIITQGCHGKLSQSKIKPNHIRGQLPEKVSNLDDFIQRKILYNHKQSIKLTEWIIEHNLGISPNIQVFIERPKRLESFDNISLITEKDLVQYIEIEPLYKKSISANTVIIGFDRPEKGIAQLLAKSSNKSIKSQTRSTDKIQFKNITNNSEVSIGTLLDNPTITLEFAFLLPNANILYKTYIIDDSPSINSAWSNFNNIFVNSRKYKVRSFNLNSVIFNDIPDGSSFWISKLNNLQINQYDILFLISEKPYTTNDKILNKVVNLYNINELNSVNVTVINSGEFLINLNNIQNVYPFIKRI